MTGVRTVLRRRGSPVEIVLTREMPGPPQVVWDLITDWERQDDWMLEASDVAVLTPFREGVGVEAEATIRMGGITTRDRIRVETWVPLRHLGIQHAGWVTGSGDLYLTALPDGRTHVAWREELHPPLGALGSLGIRIFRPLMRRTFSRDLRILESLVRARTSR